MRIVFFGTPDFAVPSLKALMEAGHEVVLVVTQPDKLKGRGHILSQPPVKVFAVSKGVEVIQPAGIRSDEFYQCIAELAPDAIAVVAYGKILPGQLLKLPRRGCINVHGSLLPKYRGAAPVQWSIINGDEKTGITTMLMDEGLDTGDVLLREETEIKDEDNALTLASRLSNIGASLLVKTLAALEDGSVRPQPQSGEPTFAPPLKKEDGKIDWSLPVKRISDLVRGTYPWPGAYCFFQGEKITLLRAGIADAGVSGEFGAESKKSQYGSIVKIGRHEVLVASGGGLLSMYELKPEGRKTMSAAAYANGRHIKVGASFDVS